ncbi:MAG: hypothetical protein AAF703_19645 [Cyanobacteria bacterium P01_D01_bin.105]
MVKKDDTAPVLSLDFDAKPSVSGQVRKLLPTIEHYKEQEGYSLRQIYDALYAKAHVQCAWPSFQNTYYRVRKENSEQAPGEEPKSSPLASVPQPSRSRQKSARWQSPSEGRSQQSLSGGLDLEAHQAKAKAVFDRKLLS